MWLLYQQAKTWKKLPSEVLQLTDPFVSFTVDQAVWSFGSALQGALDESEKGKKNDRQREAAHKKVFRKWLPGVEADTARFRDVAKESPEGVRR